MKDEKYNALKAKQDEMVCWSEATADAVRAKMESVRLSNNFSLPDFSELLGLPYESTYQNIVVRDRGILSLDLYLRFCYLFGYESIPPETRRKLAYALRNLGRIVDLDDDEVLVEKSE